METSDGILKWERIERNCQTCYNEIDTHEEDRCWGTGCSMDFPKGKEEYWRYANSKQIKEKIADAEAGNHKWVRDNTDFICDKQDECEETSSSHCKPHKLLKLCNGTCKWMEGNFGSCVPFRGAKGEEQTWPGINGETHLEALREIVAKENPTAVDCNPYPCKDHATKEQCENCTPKTSYIRICFAPTAEESSEVEAPCMDADEYFGKPLKVDFGKEDRSDLEYNDKKQEIKEAGLKIKEEDGGGVEFVSDDCLEYVVVKELNIDTLSQHDNVDPVVFLWFYRNFPDMDLEEGQTIRPGMGAFDQADELLRLGFIEEKVLDPVVDIGDCYSDNNMEIHRVIGDTSKCVMLVNVTTWTKSSLAWCGPIGAVKLSHLVGKDRLSEFKPCKVEISVVE